MGYLKALFNDIYVNYVGYFVYFKAYYPVIHGRPNS